MRTYSTRVAPRSRRSVGFNGFLCSRTSTTSPGVGSFGLSLPATATVGRSTGILPLSVVFGGKSSPYPSPFGESGRCLESSGPHHCFCTRRGSSRAAEQAMLEPPASASTASGPRCHTPGDDGAMTTDRQREWSPPCTAMCRTRASTRSCVAHRNAPPPSITPRLLDRVVREELEDAALADGATRSGGAGHRALPEEPDPLRTCFERDRDRILHSTAFRRLAGKTQVFVLPGRPPAHPAHPRARGRPGRHRGQPRRGAQRGAHRGHRARPRLRPRPRRPRQRGRLRPPSSPAATTTPSGGPRSCSPRSTSARETLDGIRHHSWSLPTPPPPRGRW